MKHTPFRLFAAALTLLSLGLSSCQETEREPLAPEEAEWSITVTASLPGAPAVRSGAAPGDGTAVNRCILEVYENGEFSGDRYVAPVQDLGAVFGDVHLVAGGTYDLVFWADCAAEGEDGGLTDLYYGTEAGLTRITLDTDWVFAPTTKACNIDNVQYGVQYKTQFVDFAAMYYNVNMVTVDNKLEDPYELYLKNEWTFDKFEEYCKKLTKTDASGNITVYGCQLVLQAFPANQPTLNS